MPVNLKIKINLTSVFLFLSISWQTSAAGIDLNTFLTQFRNCKILVHSFGYELSDNAVICSLVSLQSPYNIQSYDHLMSSSDWESIRDTCRIYIFNLNDQLPSHLMESIKFVSIDSRNYLKAEDETDVSLIMLPTTKNLLSINQHFAFNNQLYDWNVLGITLDIRSPDSSYVREIAYLKWNCKNNVKTCWNDVVKYETYLIMLKYRKDFNGFEVSIYLDYIGFSTPIARLLSLLSLGDVQMRVRNRSTEVVLAKLALELAAYLNFTARFEPDWILALQTSAILPGYIFPVFGSITEIFNRTIPTDMAHLHFLYCKNATVFKYENGFLAWIKPLDAICWILVLSTIGTLTIGCSEWHLTSMKWTLSFCQTLVQVGFRTGLGLSGSIVGQGGNYKKCKWLILLWVTSSLLININYGAFYTSNFIVGGEIDIIESYPDLTDKAYSSF